MSTYIKFTVLGSPQSKANSRRLVINRRTSRMMFIKSKAALSYATSFAMQCPKLSSPMEGDLRFTAWIYYRSRRNDLDDSLLLDLCQGRIYQNDRQIKERHCYWGLDPLNPRTVIEIEPLRPLLLSKSSDALSNQPTTD